MVHDSLAIVGTVQNGLQLEVYLFIDTVIS